MGSNRDIISNVRERIRARSLVTRARYLGQVHEARALHQPGAVRRIAVIAASDHDLAWMDEFSSSHRFELVTRIPNAAWCISSSLEAARAQRNVAALSTNIGLGSGTYDAALCVGLTGEASLGALLGALAFGHLPFQVLHASNHDESTLLLTALGVQDANLTHWLAQNHTRGIGELVNEASLVEAALALFGLAAKASYLRALASIARAAGFSLERTDLEELREVTPAGDRSTPAAWSDLVP